MKRRRLISSVSVEYVMVLRGRMDECGGALVVEHHVDEHGAVELLLVGGLVHEGLDAPRRIVVVAPWTVEIDCSVRLLAIAVLDAT